VHDVIVDIGERGIVTGEAESRMMRHDHAKPVRPLFREVETVRCTGAMKYDSAYPKIPCAAMGLRDADRLADALAGKPAIIALGNVDSSCGDYRIEPGGSYLVATRAMVRRLVGAERLEPDFDATYAAGGYYAARHPTVANGLIVVVNDVLWSTLYRDACGTDGLAAAQTMLGWLRDRLARQRAAGGRVWLVHHIPWGIDPYTTINTTASSCPAKVVPFQQEPFEQWYRDGRELFAEHLVRVGEVPDNHAIKNLPLLRVLDAAGALHITTARSNGRMFGYLATLVGPSLESIDGVWATNTFFYASPAIRGLGMKLQRASIAALRERGVDEVFMLAGPRGDGPRMGGLYRRLGAEDSGQFYRLPLTDNA
jgi:hypothetical protein